MTTEQDCTLCKIGRGERPTEKLFDDGEAFAIRDKWPKAPVHVVVIPHAHVEALHAATPDRLAAAAHCLAVAPGVAKELGLDATGYRLVTNQGADAGQEVWHFHLHILGGRRLGVMG